MANDPEYRGKKDWRNVTCGQENSEQYEREQDRE